MDRAAAALDTIDLWPGRGRAEEEVGEEATFDCDVAKFHLR